MAIVIDKYSNDRVDITLYRLFDGSGLVQIRDATNEQITLSKETEDVELGYSLFKELVIREKESK